MGPLTNPPQAKSLKLDSSFLLGPDHENHNPIENPPNINDATDPSLSYKRSPHHSTLDESGKQLNYMETQADHEHQTVDILKKLKLARKSEKHGDGDGLDRLFMETMDEMGENSSHEDEEPMENKRTDTPALKEDLDKNNITILKAESQTKEGQLVEGKDYTEDSISNHPWGLIFTIIGTVLLDFDADACQSPSRAYMLDVTIPG